MSGLERLGESEDFGGFLLELIERQGWTIEPAAAFASGDVLLIARMGALEVRGSGPRTSAAALALFNEVATYFGSQKAA